VIKMDKGTTLEARLMEDLNTSIDTIDTKVGENTDAAGTTTLFAILRQIVDTYLADGTVGLTALKALIDANQVDLNAIIVDTTSIETKVDTVQTDLDNATDGLGALKALIDANQVDLDAIIVDTTSIETKVDTVDTVVDGVQTDLNNATDGLGALKSLLDINQVDMDAIIADLDNGTDGLGALKTLLDTIDGIVDRILTATEVKRSSVNDASATTTKFITNLPETQSLFWNRAAVLFTSGNNTGQMRRIKAYDGSTKEITLQFPLDAAPADGDLFILPTVRAFLTPDIEDIADQMCDELLSEHTVSGTVSQTLTDIITDTETLLQKATKTITLGTGVVPVTEALFTVSGEVELYVVGYIDIAVTSGGALTLEVGVPSATAGLIAQTAVGNLLINLLWIDATPGILVSKPSEKIIANGGDISHIIKTADATAGTITYYCFWRALSSDGNVVAA